jgi:hypothetical protein
MSDSTQQVNGWTVKNVPVDARERINSAAKRADQNVGEWLQAAAERHIQAERNGQMTPIPAPEPGKPEAYQPAGSLDVVRQMVEILPALSVPDTKLGAHATLARKVLRQHMEALLLWQDRKPDGMPALPPPAVKP